MKNYMIELSLRTQQVCYVKLTCEEDDFSKAKEELIETAEDWDAIWESIGLDARVVGNDIRPTCGIHMIYEDGVLDDA